MELFHNGVYSKEKILLLKEKFFFLQKLIPMRRVAKIKMDSFFYESLHIHPSNYAGIP